MEVQVLRRPGGARRFDQLGFSKKDHFLRVRLHSDACPGRISYADLEFGRDFRRRVEAAGGALAEHQHVTYGDVHEPRVIARVARELALEVLAGA